MIDIEYVINVRYEIVSYSVIGFRLLLDYFIVKFNIFNVYIMNKTGGTVV